MTAAVVIPGFSGTSLSVARCFHGTGHRIFPVGVPGPAPENPFFYSRIPERRFLMPDDGALIEMLRRIRRELDDDPVLLLAEDQHVLQVADALEEVSAAYRVSVPPPSVVRSLVDKVAFVDKAKELEILTPRSIIVRDRAEVPETAERLSFPLIVKPFLRHARRVDDRGQLNQYLSTLEPTHWTSVLAQEWIPGGDDCLFCCFAVLDDRSRTVAAFTLQKIRQWRPNSGTTSLCRSVEDGEVRSEGIRILEGLGVTGFGSVEFKRHPDDGRLYLMEPTVGRFNQQIALARAAGVNLPEILVAHLLGKAIPGAEERTDAVWIHELKDRLSSRDARQTVRGGYLRHLISAGARVLWASSDPGPAIAVFCSLARSLPTGPLRSRLGDGT